MSTFENPEVSPSHADENVDKNQEFKHEVIFDNGIVGHYKTKEEMDEAIEEARDRDNSH
jgi:hypothetical protein